jgi:hypothetical protein
MKDKAHDPATPSKSALQAKYEAQRIAFGPYSRPPDQFYSDCAFPEVLPVIFMECRN